MSEIFRVDPNHAAVWDRTAEKILSLDTQIAFARRFKDRQFQLAREARQRADRRESVFLRTKAMLMDMTNGEDRDQMERAAANENTGWFGRGKERRRKPVTLNGWTYPGADTEK